MNKLKENKILLTVIGFGVIIVVILLMILQQQKQNTPAAQESSYSASVKAASSSQSIQDTNNEEAYAKKAAKMKGHVLGGLNAHYTTWTKKDFRDWAEKYNSLSDADKHQASTNFGTSQTSSNNNIDTQTLDQIAESVLQNDFKSIGYYETVKEFNESNKGVDPDTIKK